MDKVNEDFKKTLPFKELTREQVLEYREKFWMLSLENQMINFKKMN
jgi:hypothetical protein